MDNELFGEMHEQEENGLFGRRHEAELCFLHSVSVFVCPYCKSERTKKLRTLYVCLDCQGTFLANER